MAYLLAVILPLCLVFVFFSSIGLRDEWPLAYSHSSMYAFFKVSPVGIHNSCSHALCESHHGIADFWTRQSRLSLFFPRALIFSFLTTNACCAFHYARAIFTTTDGKVAKSARCCSLGPSRCFATCSPFCLAHAFVCSMSPVFSA